MTATITPTMISPVDAQKSALAGSAMLIDVRSPGEYNAVHATGASLHPLDRIDQFTEPKERALLVLCQSGKRAQMAAEKLCAAGYCNVQVVEGGTQAWVAASLPVLRGKGTISIERQVRIAAGLLVVTGCVLGTWVHPYAFGLAAFVGAGLTFAGITDTCMMGLVLAKMPWNQGSSATCAKPSASAA